MNWLPSRLRFQANVRKRIMLRKYANTWVWTCPWCHAWNHGVHWNLVLGQMTHHYDLIHKDFYE